jgi:hypothetical protein
MVATLEPECDIKQTFLSVRTPGYYVVSMHGYEFTREKLNAAEVYLDTNKNNSGPEYNFEYQFDAIVMTHRQWFGKVDTWNRGGSDSFAPTEDDRELRHDVVRWHSSTVRRFAGQVRWNVGPWDVTKYYEAAAGMGITTPFPMA